MAEIARAAELSEMTVFNYFPTKEDLVFSRMEFFEERLVAAGAARSGESAVACFGCVLLAGIDQPAARADMIAKAATLIRQPSSCRPGARSHRALYGSACPYSLQKRERRRRHRGMAGRPRAH